LPTGQVSPAALSYATPQATSPVRAVGLAQRRIMWVILAALLLTLSFGVGSVIVPQSPPVQIALTTVLVIARLGIIALTMTGVYQLATALGAATSTRVLYTLAMLLPCIGLIVLLVVNQQATNLLKQHRIKVGLMGPRVADLPVA
jgi:hypothetical protein